MSNDDRLSGASWWHDHETGHSEPVALPAHAAHQYVAFVPGDPPSYNHTEEVTGIAVILGLLLALAIAVILFNRRSR